MGNLPKDRVTPSPPFQVCGVDYAGPFLTRDRRARGYKTYKCYICLFVCFSTKAIHVELVSDLTSECFLAALKRFVARRGRPQKIYSDNGTTFVGANSEMTSFYNFLKLQSEKIQSYSSNEGIRWSFIPARSPHFGGIWEAGVKSVKANLKRVIGNAVLTFELFNTLLTQIEATLNSRPLSPLSNDPSDLNPLTPAHFLVGRTLTAIPEPDYISKPINRLSHYQQCQQMHQHFWQRWSKEYLHELQQRRKWSGETTKVDLGNLVLLIEDNQPPLRWKIGRITHLHPGADGIVRVVTVKTATSEVKRAIQKLCVLPIIN